MDTDDLQALRVAWTGPRTTALRERLGWTQAEMAPHLGYKHRNRVTELEGRSDDEPAPASVAIILAYLDRHGPLDARAE